MPFGLSCGSRYASESWMPSAEAVSCSVCILSIFHKGTQFTDIPPVTVAETSLLLVNLSKSGGLAACGGIIFVLKQAVMKRIITIAIALIAGLSGASAQDILGKWKLDDGTAIVEIIRNGNVYDGKIVWLEEPFEKDGTPAVDSKNPDKSLRSRELMGLKMLIGLKDLGEEYGQGQIYDPGNGKTYHCSMKVQGDVLKVRGSLDKKGLLGRTMDWFRVQ